MGTTELFEVKGLGQAKVTQIKAALDIARRFSQEEIRCGESFRSGAEFLITTASNSVVLRKGNFRCFSLMLRTESSKTWAR